VNSTFKFIPLLLVSAALAACGTPSSTIDPLPTGVTPTAISGTLNGWTGGAATVALLADDTRAQGAGNPALSTGTLNADGSFTLALPGAEQVKPFLIPTANLFVASNPNCLGQFTSSNAAAQGFVAYRLDVQKNGASVMSAEPFSFTDQSDAQNVNGTVVNRFWVYSDQATMLGGQQTCSASANGVITGLQAKMNANLHAGWNLMREVSTLNVVRGSSTASITVTLESSDDASGPWEMQALGQQSVTAAHVAPYLPR